MTIICALHDPSTVETWIGCNTGVTLGRTLMPSSCPKWIIQGEWALGHVGMGRTLDLLNAEAKRLCDKLADPFEFVRRLREVFEEANFVDADDDDAVPSYGQYMILANRTAVWDIDKYLSLGQIEAGQLWARGSGEDFALGAAHALQDLGLPPAERVRKALEAAMANDLYSPGAIILQKLGG